MELLLKLREKEFAFQVNELIRVTGKAAAEAVKDEARLLTADVVKMTPPFAKGPSTESFNTQRRTGEKAVERDVKRAFWVLDLTKIRNGRVRKTLEKLVRKNDLERIKTWLQYMKIPVRDVLREASPGVHDELRDKRGRVRKSKGIWVIKGPSVKRLVRERKSHVGKAKAGWLAAAQALGVKLPAWISRHVASLGLFTDLTRDRSNPRVIIANLVDYIQGSGAELRIINRALANRSRNLRVKIERILKSAWYKKRNG